jgi:hypothetical protein
LKGRLKHFEKINAKLRKDIEAARKESEEIKKAKDIFIQTMVKYVKESKQLGERVGQSVDIDQDVSEVPEGQDEFRECIQHQNLPDDPKVVKKAKEISMSVL